MFHRRKLLLGELTTNLRLQIFLLIVLLFGIVGYCKICYVTHDDKVTVGLFVCLFVCLFEIL
jgi:hypothetical protein